MLSSQPSAQRFDSVDYSASRRLSRHDARPSLATAASVALFRINNCSHERSPLACNAACVMISIAMIQRVNGCRRAPLNCRHICSLFLLCARRVGYLRDVRASRGMLKAMRLMQGPPALASPIPSRPNADRDPQPYQPRDKPFPTRCRRVKAGQRVEMAIRRYRFTPLTTPPHDDLIKPGNALPRQTTRDLDRPARYPTASQRFTEPILTR